MEVMLDLFNVHVLEKYPGDQVWCVSIIEKYPGYFA
jgi:hypothetical protein